MSSMSKISHEVLRDRLHNGAVKFYFRKVSGELREAFGTLDMSRIPSSGQPKGGKRPQGVTTFFDLEKNVWRCVSFTQEIWLNQ